MNLLESYPDEALTIWLSLLAASNLHGFDIKIYIEDFFKKIEQEGLPAAGITKQNEIVKNRYYLEFYYQQAVYYTREEEHNKALTSIKKAVQIADQISRFDNKRVHQLLFTLLKS